MTIDPDKRIPTDTRATETEQKSPVAEQRPSNGPQLGFWMRAYLGIMFVFSGAVFQKATFEKWAEKHLFVQYLAKEITTDEKMQGYYETHLNALSMKQLKNFETLLKKYPGMTAEYIKASTRYDPKNLQSVLLQLVDDFSQTNSILKSKYPTYQAMIVTPKKELDFSKKIEGQTDYEINMEKLRKNISEAFTDLG